MAGRTVFSLFGRIALQGMEKLNADLKAGEKGANELKKVLGNLGSTLSKTGTTLTKNLSAPIAAITGAIGLLSVKTGEYASKLSSLNSATGLSTDTLQELAHVSRVAGTSADGVYAVISKLTPKLDEIAKGSGAAAEALHGLGINVTNADGSLRSMDDLFPEIISGLQSITDTTTRNNVATQIFGGRIADLAPVLDMSTNEFNRLRQAAHDTGKVMSGDALQTADKFRIGFEDLKAGITMAFMSLAVGLMPVLTDTFIPLVQSTVIPVLQSVVSVIGTLAGWFGKLPPPIQITIGILGALVAALGPVLLLSGQIMLSTKKLIPEIVKIATVTKTYTAALWAKVAALGALKLASGAGILAIIGLEVATRKLNAETKEYNKETARISERTNELHKQVKDTEKLVKDYEKLKGSELWDEQEFKRLIKAQEDAVIVLKDHSLAVTNQNKMTEKEIELTRQNIQAKYGLAEAVNNVRLSEWEQAKVNAENEKKIEEEKRAAEERRRIAKQRIDDLNSLVGKHKEAYEDMNLSEMSLLYKEEERELERATKLKASEEQLETIRKHYDLRTERLRQESQDKINDINTGWNDKLLNQSGDRIKILENEKEREIAIATKAGADTAKIHEYYKKEVEKLEKEKADNIVSTNQQWQDKIEQQYGDRLNTIKDHTERTKAIEAYRLQILETERVKELSLAHEIGSDVNLIENYYETERIRIKSESENAITEKAKEEADKRKAYIEQWVGFVSNSINKIGSLFSKASSNEEKRLSDEYKQRREHIENTITDEETRNARLEELRQEEDEKKLAIQQKQAERDKRLGIFNTIVDTAVAIVRTLRDMGPIAGPIMAGVIGGLGIAQTAVIASEPVPMAKGAYVIGGSGGVHAQVGEGKEDELVLPMKSGTRQLAEDLSDIAFASPQNNNTNNTYEIHIHAGTVIADNYSVKQFGRKIIDVIASENKRTGRG